MKSRILDLSFLYLQYMPDSEPATLRDMILIQAGNIGLILILQVGMGQSPTVPSHLSDEGKLENCHKQLISLSLYSLTFPICLVLQLPISKRFSIL